MKTKFQIPALISAVNNLHLTLFVFYLLYLINKYGYQLVTDGLSRVYPELSPHY